MSSDHALLAHGYRERTTDNSAQLAGLAWPPRFSHRSAVDVSKPLEAPLLAPWDSFESYGDLVVRAYTG